MHHDVLGRGVANRIAAVAAARGNGGQVLAEYSSALSGFAAALPQGALDI